MPYVFIGPIKAAETNAHAQQALSTPHVARGHWRFSQFQCFTAVHQHFYRLFNICFQQILESVIVFILRTFKELCLVSNRTSIQFYSTAQLKSPGKVGVPMNTVLPEYVSTAIWWWVSSPFMILDYDFGKNLGFQSYSLLPCYSSAWKGSWFLPR